MTHEPSGRGLEEALQHARSLLAETGPIERRAGRLFAGDRPLDADPWLVDAVGARTGHGCTLFDRNVRVATTAVAAGTSHRAVGTSANDDITRRVFRLGGAFRGITRTLGKDWVIAYDPLRDSAGRIVGMLAVYRELFDFQGDLSRLSVPTAVLRVAAGGRVRDLNDAAADYAGRPREEVLGLPVETWLRTDWSAVPPTDVLLECPWVQADGYTLTAQAECRWLGDGHLVVVRDFTAEVAARVDLAAANEDLERARREADRANEAKSMFLANVSHELRTPLTAILGYTQLLREEAPAAFDSDLGRVESSATFLLALIDDLLDLTKARAGKLEVRCRPVALAPLLAEVRTVGERLASGKENRFVSTGQGDVVVLGDDTRIRQVLLNLVSNACKFTRGGTVGLEVATDARHVELTVHDTGIGMDAAQLERLFLEFSQVHAGRSELGGTGLGLALSKRLANAMDGELTVTSRPGDGSRFCLRLPLAPPSMPG